MKSYIFGLVFFMVFGAWLLGINPASFMVLTAIILFAIIFSLGLMIIVVLLSEENIGPGGKK